MQDVLLDLQERLTALFKDPSAEKAEALTPLFQFAVSCIALEELTALLERVCDSHKRLLMKKEMHARDRNEQHTYALELHHILRRKLLAIARVKLPLEYSSWEEGEGPAEGKCWIDGSVKQASAGIGVVLACPTRVVTLSERTEAKTSHEAETKALLAALRLACNLRIFSLCIRTDAQSLVSHIHEIKNQNYSLFSQFKKIRLTLTPRVFNRHADALADLAHLRHL